MKIPRILLLQGRRLEDPVRLQEVESFARAIDYQAEQIKTLDLVRDRPSLPQVAEYDIVLVGGSGDYSIVGDEPWTDDVLGVMQGIHDLKIPTFASCWGFQAMARALGGHVVTDLERAELGTHPVTLTQAAQHDPLFADCPSPILVQLGHEDIVTQLPGGAILLGSSQHVENQVFSFPDRQLYCTQFHPELTCQDLRRRCRAYPTYVEKIARVSIEEFLGECQETPEANKLLKRFISLVIG